MPDTRAQTPNFVKPEMDDPDRPEELGGANARPTGAWRVLRNGIALAVLALAGAALVSWLLL